MSSAESNKPPLWYAKLLEREREATGMDRKEFSAKSKLNYEKVWRNETGHADRSVKGSAEVRAALIKLGRKVPPVPVGDVEEPEPGVYLTDELVVDDKDPKAALIRKNLRPMREGAGYDLEGAADAAGIAYDTLLAYERGEEKPTLTDLGLLAGAYGHEVGDFWMESPPKTKLEPFENLWFRRRLKNVPEGYRERMTEELNHVAKTIAAEFTITPGKAELRVHRKALDEKQAAKKKTPRTR